VQRVADHFGLGLM